jgi:hypothetical protein
MSQSAIIVEPPGHDGGSTLKPPGERRMSLEEWAAMPEDYPGEHCGGVSATS